HTLPRLVAVTVRTDQPINLVSAFEEPIVPDTEKHTGIAPASVRRLAHEQLTAVRAWGNKPAFAAHCHTLAPEHRETAAALEEAFGRARAFDEVLSDLRTHLTGGDAR
ncbi:type I-E CRISPR-associated protein Cas7/Cse4/CasC, partial [Streptomyces alkaliphilus]